MRAIVPALVKRTSPALTAGATSILSAAPDLAVLLPDARLSVPATIRGERVRFHTPDYVGQVSNGLVDVIRSWAVAHTHEHPIVWFDDADAADPSELLFLAALLRRVDPELMQVVIGLNSEQSPEPLATALSHHADKLPAGRLIQQSTISHDGDADTRPEQHGIQALIGAMETCISLGCYHAAYRHAERGLALTTWQDHPAARWKLSSAMGMILLAFYRPDDALTLHEESRKQSSDPQAQRLTAHSIGMIHARDLPPERRDFKLAHEWLERAIALAAALSDPTERAARMALHENGAAFVAMHAGDASGAMQLIEQALSRAEQLPHGEDPLLAVVLRSNRAKLHVREGRAEAALRDYDTVIALDPHNPQHFLDRGALRRKLGQLEAAGDDFDTAIALGPPMAEAHYNRADVFAELGDEAAALAQLDRALDLSPDLGDALEMRAFLRCEAGDLRAAVVDVERGLAVRGDSAQLWYVRAMVDEANGDVASAIAHYGKALALDPTLTAAVVNRAVLCFEQGDVDAAIADLSQAIQRDDNPVARYNRALAYQSKGEWRQALDDISAALAMEPEDRAQLLLQRGICYQHLGKVR